MRWPFGPPHLTLKHSNKKHTKKPNPQKNTKKTNKDGLGPSEVAKRTKTKTKKRKKNNK